MQGETVRPSRAPVTELPRMKNAFRDAIFDQRKSGFEALSCHEIPFNLYVKVILKTSQRPHASGRRMGRCAAVAGPAPRTIISYIYIYICISRTTILFSSILHIRSKSVSLSHRELIARGELLMKNLDLFGILLGLSALI